jgi:tetratricopeptide (TPR) repeat protein
MQAAQPALSDALAEPAPEQPAVSAGGQLSIEPVDAAVSIAQPARAPEQHSSGMTLSETTLPALAVQLQQLRQWQLAKNWSAVLAAVTPALRQQYPQQVLALEAYAASQQGDHQRALQAAQLWARHSPMDGRGWLAQAIALDQLGQPASARELYLRALQLGGLSVASQQYIRQRLAGGG